MTSQLTVRAAVGSNLGLRRSNNQDTGMAERGIYAVCDGMGGGVGGQAASQASINRLRQLADQPVRSRALICQALEASHKDVTAIGRDRGGLSGTTLTGLIAPLLLADCQEQGPQGAEDTAGQAQDADAFDHISEAVAGLDVGTGGQELIGLSSVPAPPAAQRFPDFPEFLAGLGSQDQPPLTPDGADIDPLSAWYVVNIGDSRTYHMNLDAEGRPIAGSLLRITHDHSRRQEAIDMGVVLPDVAEATIPRNIITQCIGSPEGIDPDFYAVVPSGRFIICSDGLHGEIDDSVIAQVSAANPAPQAAVDQLIQAALDAGGHDNVTVVVVDLKASPEPASGGKDASAHTQPAPGPWQASKLADHEVIGQMDDQTLDAIRPHAAEQNL
ncbi:protein phosphatase [Bifidobacterium aemilianum]|uniref:Protein phosphatase n=1 Tax=Bifidobacterium aemilianum TaxID=2493120 RepID=A0A366K6C3_9BIFI|nr:PP2C family serine/threonine-protein phosphatase [Bifidobacterium aemilianum]RBP97219.1 protein phosphatase [Bifidobacterium aemilianum]